MKGFPLQIGACQLAPKSACIGIAMDDCHAFFSGEKN
jgi:hypothetical protein